MQQTQKEYIKNALKNLKIFIKVEKLAKQDENFISLIDLSDVAITEYNAVIKINKFVSKAMHNNLFVDTYYCKNKNLHVISMDLDDNEENKIVNELVITSNEWTFNEIIAENV